MTWFQRKLDKAAKAASSSESTTAPKTTRIVVNIMHHPTVCIWMKRPHNEYIRRTTLNRTVISDEAQQWLAANTTGAYITEPSKSANFAAEIEFENANDAVLFKMFWL